MLCIIKMLITRHCLCMGIPLRNTFVLVCKYVYETYYVVGYILIWKQVVWERDGDEIC